MEEVKAREEEYETIKSVQSRMKGLPDGFVLASRKRRLLGQGVMHRVVFSEKEIISSGGGSVSLAAGVPAAASVTTSPPMPNIAKLFPVTLTSSSPHSSPHRSPHRSPTSRSFPSPAMAYAAGTRPGSTASDSGASCYSDSSMSDYHGVPPSFPSFTVLPGNIRSTLNRADSITSSCPSSVDAHGSGYPSQWVPSLPSGGGSASHIVSTSSVTPRMSGARVKTKETPVHVFVFSDLVILATRTTAIVMGGKEGGLLKNARRRSSVSASSPGGASAESGGTVSRRNSVSGATKEVHWEVLKSIGICRVVGVTDQSGKGGQSFF